MVYRGSHRGNKVRFGKGCSISMFGRKAPLRSNKEYEVISIDATESPIERLKTKTVLFRKEKADTLKTHMLENLKDGQIIFLPFANGKKHDLVVQRISRTCPAGNDTGSRYRVSGTQRPTCQFDRPHKTLNEQTADKAGMQVKQREFQTAHLGGVHHPLR